MSVDLDLTHEEKASLVALERGRERARVLRRKRKGAVMFLAGMLSISGPTAGILAGVHGAAIACCVSLGMWLCVVGMLWVIDD